MEIHLLYYALTICILLVAVGSHAWRDIYDRARGFKRVPIDGSWSSWQSWSSCYKNIMSKGRSVAASHAFFSQWEGFNIQSRNRTCTNPRPFFGGNHCQPPSHKFQQCSCMNPLLGTHRIPDSLLSASSNVDGYPAKEVRFSNTSSEGWCGQDEGSLFTDDTYIQIDFQNFTTVGAITTIDNIKGRIILFKLKYSLNGITWIVVNNNKNKKAFTGNYLHGKWKKNNFSSYLVMRYLRLIPVQHFDLPCLRMELYGCVFTCGSRLTASSGELVSQSSEYYDHNCLWRIEVLNMTSLTFVFSTFYVRCEDGYIDFYDDPQFINAPLLKRVCLSDGSNGIPNLRLNRNSVWVNFVSNSSGNEVIFNIKYSSKCIQVVHLIRGEPVHIKSPNFPDNYFNNLNCTWTLIPPSSSEKVEITVNQFSVESSQSAGKCDNDVVIVTEYNGDIKRKFAAYCNNNKPPLAPEKINITAEKIVISFKSDSVTSDKGFNFRVISVGLKDTLPTASIGEDKIHTLKTAKPNGSKKDINAGSKRNFNSTGTKKIKPDKDDAWTVIIICTFSSLVVLLIGIVLYLNCRRFVKNRNVLTAQCAKVAAEERKGKNKNRSTPERHGLLTPTSSPSKVVYTGSPEHVEILTATCDIEDISEGIETIGHTKCVHSDVDNETVQSPDQVDGGGESISYDTSTPSSSPVKTIVINYGSSSNVQPEECPSAI